MTAFSRSGSGKYVKGSGDLGPLLGQFALCGNDMTDVVLPMGAGTR